MRHSSFIVRRLSYVLALFAILSGVLGLASGIGMGTASASLSPGGYFGSDVPALANETLVTTALRSAFDANGNGSVSAGEQPSSGLTTLLSFTSGGSGALANGDYGNLPSEYGLAYDDGTVSGVSGGELLIGGYYKAYVPANASVYKTIYRYRLSTGVVSVFATANTGTANDQNDVGKVGFGDMEVGPDGKSLYAVNLGLQRVDVFSLASGGQTGSIALGVSGVPASRFRPFGLEFRPRQKATDPVILEVGAVDSQEGVGGTPTAYVIQVDTTNGGSSVMLTQKLNGAGISDRLACKNSSNGPEPGWSAWEYDANGWGQSTRVCQPQPMVSDIQFNRDATMMAVAFRDRAGDMFYSQKPPTNKHTDLAQGDTLVYRGSGSSWSLQAPTDFYADGEVGTSSGGAHSENNEGALTAIYDGSPMKQQLVSTVITPKQGETSGARWYPMDTGGSSVASIELIGSGEMGGGKASGLGDIEELAAYAWVGDRVWDDANGNGVQDSGEVGISGVKVELINTSGTVKATATTADGSDSKVPKGTYMFAVQPNVAYTLHLADSNFTTGNVLFNKVLSPKDAGDDTLDSDADQITRAITVPGQIRDSNDMNFDFGLMQAALSKITISGLAWTDNGNGIREAGEALITDQSITASLVCQSVACQNVTLPPAQQLGTTGRYLFSPVVPGIYRVQFTLPAGAVGTLLNAGSDDTIDSDANASTNWLTGQYTAVSGDVIDHIDLGILQTKSVVITKSGPTTAAVGTQFDYAIAWKNQGASPVANTVINDTLPAGLAYVSSSPGVSAASGQNLTWNLGTVAGNASGTITVRVTVLTSAPTSVTNVASVTTAINTTPQTSIWTTQIVRPDVSVLKMGPATAAVGTQFSYTLSYGNGGTGPAANVTIQDVLPVGLTFVSASPAVNSVSGRTLTWGLGTLAANQNGSITVVVSADLTAPNSVTNVATIATTTIGDQNTGNDTSKITTQILRPNVKITKTGPSTVPLGSTITYQLVAQNTGTLAAAGVKLVDALPAGLSYQSSSPAASVSGRTLTWNLGTMAAGQSTTLTVVALVTESAPADLNNTGTITTTSPGDDPTDNDSTWHTTVQRPNVYITITTPSTALVDDGIKITLTYGNNGTIAADNVTVDLTTPAGVTLIGQKHWDIGTVPVGATRTITVRAHIDNATPPSKVFKADIDTTTIGDLKNDNHDESTTVVTAPPPPPDVNTNSDLKIRIHSDLDANWNKSGGDASSVYLSDGTTIAWPAGEVMDWTPYLELHMPSGSSGYKYEMTILGWSLVNVSGKAAEAPDSKGIAGCRERAEASQNLPLQGCQYQYLDDSSPTVDQLHQQAHTYWTAMAPEQMRKDVYVNVINPLIHTEMTVQIAVEVKIINPNADTDGDGIGDGPKTVSDEIQTRNGSYTVNLVVPRSVK